MKRELWLFFFLLLISFLGLPVLAESRIVLINSPDWKDIYSGIIYANLNGLPFNFLSTEKQFTYKITALQNYKQIVLIEPKANPLVFGYKADLEQKRFDVEKPVVTKTVNLDLGKLTDTKRFILLDGRYPHNAISVVPYSTLTKAYVLFVDKDNIDDIVSLLHEKNAEKVLLYGFIDPAIKEKLAGFNPEEINEGDRFRNNIAIVKKYIELSPVKQTVLTSGNFIEDVIMKGAQPILFIGETEVSDELVDYLTQSDIYVGEVVGNELTRSATKLKRLLKNKGKEFFVVVRFGKATIIGGAEEPKKVSALDMVYLPEGILNLTISSVAYNRATRQLEVTYSNAGKVSVYLRSTIKVIVNGKQLKTTGDEEPFFILPGENRIMGYNADLSEMEPLEEKSMVAELLTRYGEGTKTLDKVLEGSYPVALQQIADDSALEIVKVTYSADIYKSLFPWKTEQAIKVTVRNTGERRTYYKTALMLNRKGVDETLKTEEISSLDTNKEDSVAFRAFLEDVNPKIKVDIAYGGKKDLLFKRLRKEMTMEPVYYSDIVVFSGLVAIVLILLWLLVGKKKKKKKAKKKSKAQKDVGQRNLKQFFWKKNVKKKRK